MSVRDQDRGRPFGKVSSRQWREAELFLQDLVGKPPRGRPRAVPLQLAAPATRAGDPASIFDGIVHRGASPDQIVLDHAPDTRWQVVALPGAAAPPDSLRRGDLVI